MYVNVASSQPPKPSKTTPKIIKHNKYFNMKAFWITILVASGSLLQAQITYEVKTDALTPFFRSGGASFEASNTRHFGMELDVRVLSSKVDYHSFDPAFVCVDECYPEFFEGRASALNATFHVKYYLQSAERKFRFFTSAYLRSDRLISRMDKSYNAAFISFYGINIDPNDTKAYRLRNALGISFGFKYLMQRHWLIEASLGLDRDRWETSSIEDLNGLPALKLGYRF